jgi:hypothetical protein
MTTTPEALGAGTSGEVIGLLAKERTVAGQGFNRWLVPPCALAILWFEKELIPELRRRVDALVA